MSDGTDAHPADAGPRSVRARLAVAWGKALRNPSAMILLNTGTQSVLRMGSNIVLARLLAPSAFALIAITSLILTGMQMVSDVGIAVTALREGEMSREDEHKLWTMQLLRGIGVGLLMVAAAVPVGWLYNDPQLRDVLFALALMPVLQGMASLYPVLALGHRRLVPTTLLEVGARTAGIIGSIAVALVSPTVWSLVVGTLAGVVFSTIGSHLLAGYGPRLVIDRAYLAKQWRFSRWIQAASTLYFLGGQVDKPLFPFLFGMTTLGIYGIGAAFAAIPAQVTQRWSASVFYPLTTKLLRGGAGARAQLLHVRMTMLLYTGVLTLMMVAVAPAFFTLLYQPQYHPAMQFAQILAIGIFFDTGESSLRHMPLVEGVPQYEVWAVVVRLIAFVVAAAVVVALHGNAFHYALAVIIGSSVGHLYMLAVCVRRGYVRAGPDLLLIAGLVAAAVALYWIPHPTGSIDAVVRGLLVGVVTLALLAAIYLRRGLPSLPAEPAPETLREAAAEELDPVPNAV